jgi:hypothetical protein
MKFVFEAELPHQVAAIDSVVDLFAGQEERQSLFTELCGRMGDDGVLKAAYRGGCRACQNLSSRAIRLWRHLPTSSGFVSLKTSTIP